MTDSKKKKVTIPIETEAAEPEPETLSPPAEGTQEAAESLESVPSESRDQGQDTLQEKADLLEKEKGELYDRLLRVSAEFENYRKRAAREAADFRKFANENLLKAMLPALDNLDRALASAKADDAVNACVVEGVELTLKEMFKVLEQFGVKPVESLSKPFDPAFHEAVMRAESGEHPENTVIQEFQKGYLLHDRLLRPAMVVVSTSKGKD